jgi:hypothetical protein
MAESTNQSPVKVILVIIIVAVIAVLAYSVLTMPDNRSGAERLGDAISELPNGVDKAANELEDRTPGEKIGEAVKDAGENIKENTDGK